MQNPEVARNPTEILEFLGLPSDLYELDDQPEEDINLDSILNNHENINKGLN